MKTLKLLLLILTSVILVSFTRMKIQFEFCSMMHHGTFKYGNLDDEVTFTIKGKHHVEYHDNGKYYIKSKIDWVNECEYNMTMKKITLPNFPYHPGDVMNVRIDSIENKLIYYTAKVKNMSWNGTMIKIAE